MKGGEEGGPTRGGRPELDKARRRDEARSKRGEPQQSVRLERKEEEERTEERRGELRRQPEAV